MHIYLCVYVCVCLELNCAEFSSFKQSDACEACSDDNYKDNNEHRGLKWTGSECIGEYGVFIGGDGIPRGTIIIQFSFKMKHKSNNNFQLLVLKSLDVFQILLNLFPECPRNCRDCNGNTPCKTCTESYIYDETAGLCTGKNPTNIHVYG